MSSSLSKTNENKLIHSNSLSKSRDKSIHYENDIIGYYLSKCVGKKISKFFSCFIGLNLKESVEKKYRRLLMLFTIIIGDIIAICFATLTFMFLNDFKVSLDFSSVLFFNNVIVSFIFTVMLVLFLAIRTKKNFDVVLFFFFCVIGIEAIDMAHICGNKGILSSCNISLLSIPLIICLFVYESTKTKLFFIGIFVINIVAMFVYDICMTSIQKPALLEYINRDYYLNMIIVWVDVLLPIFLLVFLYFLRTVSEMKFLKKRVKTVFKHMQNFEVEEREANELIAHLEIDSSLFRIQFNDIKIVKTVGSGGSNSIVFEVDWKGTKACFKCFKIQDFLEKERFREFEKEAKILASVSHPNILVFYGCSLEAPRIGILMEFCTNGDIQTYLEWNTDTSHIKKVDWLIEICKAMNYLHSKNIIHRDLKPRNVLLNKQLVCKVMDFGISKIVGNTIKSKTHRVGTLKYMAPEVSTSSNYDEKVDVFSFSIMLFEVITNNFDPYGSETSGAGSFNIDFKIANDSNFRPDINNTSIKPHIYLSNLMENCWNHNPKNRPSFEKIINILENKKEIKVKKKKKKKKSKKKK